MKISISAAAVKRGAVDGLLIILGSILYTVGTCVFIFPSSLLLGGTSGISVILNRFLPFSPSMILTGINIVLVFLALIILGKGMAIKTLAGSLATTLFIALFDIIFPSLQPIVPGVYASAAIGGAIIAIASGILFFCDASSGGTDIIALIIKKYTPLKIGKALLVTDLLIVIVGGILSGLRIGIASFIGLLVKTLGIDLVILIIRGLSGKKSNKSHTEA